MRVSVRMFVLSVAALGCLALSGATAWAQNHDIKGKVADSSKRPLMGATIDFYRTDQGGSFQTKTDAGGKFSQAVPQGGTYIIVVSAKNHSPKIMPDVKAVSGLPEIEFSLDSGSGARPSLEDAKAMISGGPTEAEKAEYEKQLALKKQFDAKKVHFDTGVKAMQSKDYTTAISELTASLQGLDESTDIAYWGELMNAAGGNLAETHYRVAVDLFNNKQRDEAKGHLEKGAKAIAIAIKANPAEPVNYAIQGKTLLLLVDKYSMSDYAEIGATAFLKAAEAETVDNKQKVDYLVKAGDVYRTGFLTDKAIETYKQVLALDSDNASAMYGIGLAAMSTSEENDAKRKQIYQTAADYLNAFVNKVGSDPRAVEAKAVLATLASDYKIKPRPLNK